jgi:hypothetical protein
MTLITVAAQSKSWTVSARSNTEVVDSNPTPDMEVCVQFSVFALSYMQVGALRRADPLSKEPYRLCIGLRNWKSGQGQTKRIVDRQTDRQIDRYLTTLPIARTTQQRMVE